MLHILMSDFTGKSAHVLEEEAIKKASELDIEPILFPENGIHPEFHMELADRQLRLKKDSLIVTHSENLLLRVLRRIERKEILPTNISLLILTPYVNNKDKGFAYWKNLEITEEGEFIDFIPGGFFEQAYNESSDLNHIDSLNE